MKKEAKLIWQKSWETAWISLNPETTALKWWVGLWVNITNIFQNKGHSILLSVSAKTFRNLKTARLDIFRAVYWIWQSFEGWSYPTIGIESPLTGRINPGHQPTTGEKGREPEKKLHATQLRFPVLLPSRLTEEQTDHKDALFRVKEIDP